MPKEKVLLKLTLLRFVELIQLKYKTTRELERMHRRTQGVDTILGIYSSSCTMFVLVDSKESYRDNVGRSVLVDAKYSHDHESDVDEV